MGVGRNRSVGHSFERDCVKKFKLAGFEHVATSRLVNRSRDNEKVDLANSNELVQGRFPYNVQCKSVTGTLNYVKHLHSLEVIPGIRNVVLHRKTEKKPENTNFMVTGRYAFLYFEDFMEMVAEIEHLKSIVNGQGSTD